MKNITKLPLLNELINLVYHTKSLNLGNIVFICVQHLLPTTVCLFDAMICLGAKPENIFVAGKQYSTLNNVKKTLESKGIKIQNNSVLPKLGDYSTAFKNDIIKMWEKVYNHVLNNFCEMIIILDDGGRCLELLDDRLIDKVPMIGIEQTTAGIINHQFISYKVPFIDVATSAAKKFFESQIIVDEIIESVKEHLLNKEKNITCGVVGLGTIGSNVAKTLIDLGFNLIVYDINKLKDHSNVINVAKTLEELFIKSDCVFGCTGRDITEEIDFSLLHSKKILISCSSEDKEFLTLLRKIQEEIPGLNPYHDIHYSINNIDEIQILNGGFPVNFNKRYELANRDKIQLTRALLFGAILQAKQEVSITKHAIIKLNSSLQYFLIKQWEEYCNQTTKNHIKLFSDLKWIAKNSGGKSSAISKLEFIKAEFVL